MSLSQSGSEGEFFVKVISSFFDRMKTDIRDDNFANRLLKET